MRIVRASACALVAVLAGCSGPPAPSTSLPPMPVAAFDGQYRATVQVSGVGAGGDRSWCQTLTGTTLNVAADQFSLSLPHPNVPGSPVVTFAVAIAPDGSFQAQSEDGTAMFAGRVSGGHLQGIVNGAGCQYSVSADRT